MSTNKTFNVGVITAYGAAKSAGYTGTYEQFCEELAHFAENAAQVARDKETTKGYRDEAKTAKDDAQTAQTGAEQFVADAEAVKRQVETISEWVRTDASQASNSAREANASAEEAKQNAQDIEDLTVTAVTLETGEEAYVEKTKSGNMPYNLEFGLPKGAKGDKGDKGNIMFANFYIGDDGFLYIAYDEEYAGPGFRINEHGYLEVLV